MLLIVLVFPMFLIFFPPCPLPLLYPHHPPHHPPDSHHPPYSHPPPSPIYLSYPFHVPDSDNPAHLLPILHFIILILRIAPTSSSFLYFLSSSSFYLLTFPSQTPHLPYILAVLIILYSSKYSSSFSSFPSNSLFISSSFCSSLLSHLIPGFLLIPPSFSSTSRRPDPCHSS